MSVVAVDSVQDTVSSYLQFTAKISRRQSPSANGPGGSNMEVLTVIRPCYRPKKS